MRTAKQVTITLPKTVVERAEKLSKEKLREDGLKLTATAVLREWLLKGANSNV